MRWNWQQPEWPEFTYDAGLLRPLEDRFLKGAGVAVGAMAHLADGDRGNLTSTHPLRTAGTWHWLGV